MPGPEHDQLRGTYDLPAPLLYVDLLTPDYDPWAGFERPDRAGQLERAPRKKTRGSDTGVEP